MMLGSCRNHGDLGLGLLFGCGMVSTQPFASLTCWLNQLQRGGVCVLAQLASGGGKLVEPACSLCERVVLKPW